MTNKFSIISNTVIVCAVVVLIASFSLLSMGLLLHDLAMIAVTVSFFGIFAAVLTTAIKGLSSAE